MRIGIPFLNAALAEDDDNLQDLWANLLASALTEADQTHSTKTFVEVLKQVDVADAVLLNILYRLHLRGMAKPEEATYLHDSGKYDGIQISVALNNLGCLGLLKICKDEDKSEADEVRINLWFTQQGSRGVKAQVRLTLFGIHLMRVCTDRKMILSDGSEIFPIEDRFYYPTPSKKS